MRALAHISIFFILAHQQIVPRKTKTKMIRRRQLKNTLQLMSQLLWVMSLIVGLSGFYLVMCYRKSSLYFSHSNIILPGVLALTSAGFLVVIGCIGFWLSFRDSTFLQGLVRVCVVAVCTICASMFGLSIIMLSFLQFVYLLVLVFSLESTASALSYFHSTKLYSELTPLSGMLKKYTGSSKNLISQAVDTTQKELQCCGIHDYKDWLDTPWFNHTGGLLVPYSCCNYTFLSCNGTLDLPQQLYTKGCQEKLEMVFKFVLGFITWGFPVIFLLEVVSLATVAQLMREQPLVEYQFLGKKERYWGR